MLDWYRDRSWDVLQVQKDLGVLAQQAVPLELRTWNGLELPGGPGTHTQYADIVFQVVLLLLN